MNRLLVIEDQPSDLRIATDVAQSLGISEIEARTSSRAGQIYLQAALDAQAPLPDSIVLDLDLGYESGYELLRFWHSNPKLSPIRMIIWTVLGEEQREICRLFKVHAVVSKWEGSAALKSALESKADTVC